MRLWVRAAASRSVGLGHLLRQVAVAEAVGHRGVPTTFVVDDPTLAREVLARFDHLEPGVVEAGPAWLSAVAAGDVVLFDGYDFGPADHRAAAATGALVAAVDDRGTGRFEVGVLCDHNPLPADYDLPAGAVLLHGLDYALVREEFTGGRRPAPEDHRHLLVAFGGSDAGGLLPEALAALAGRAHFPTVTVLVGPAAAVPQPPHPAGVEVVVAPDRPAEVHQRADAALVTVGTTVWELLARGVPTAAIGLDPLHRRFIDTMVAAGALVDAGPVEQWAGTLDATLARLADAGERQRLIAGATSLVDGRGPARVAEVLLGRAGEAVSPAPPAGRR